MALRVLFMGTPDFAVHSFDALCEAGYDIVGVVTQPDRPKGRGRELASPPVKLAAEQRGIPIWQPERIRDDAVIAQLAALEPDMAVTAAYGQLLPRRLLSMPRLDCVNVHGSLLPRYRGGAPIQRALMAGETETGVTIMRMAMRLDAGPMFEKVVVPITSDDNFGTLHDKMAVAGAKLLVDVLPHIANGSVQPVEQEESAAIYAPILTRDDERLDWSCGAWTLHNQVRALSPGPGAFTLWKGASLKVLRATTASSKPIWDPVGAVVAVDSFGIHVATGNGGVLTLLEVQLAGKRRTSASEFARGQRLEPGAIFGKDAD